MKKLRIALALVFGSIFTIAQAQDFDLGYVDLNFCNTQNQLHMQTAAGTQTGFCFVLNNLSNKTGTIKLALVDGEMSVGENPVKACKTTSSWFFSKFVMLSWAATGGLIVLPPNTGVVQRANVNIPAEFIGMLNGCVAFTVDDGQSNWSGMFQIVNRKANIMDIAVSGAYVNMFWFMDMEKYSGDKWQLNSQEKTISSDSSIIVTQLQEKNKLIIGLKNTGFIDENYVVTGTISNNYFGQTIYTKAFVIASGTLYGQDKVVLEYSLDDLPFYKGKYSIDVTVSHKPIELSGFSFDQDIASTTSNQSVSIMIYPSLLAIMYILIPILIIGAVISIIVVLGKRKLKTAKQHSHHHTPAPRKF